MTLLARHRCSCRSIYLAQSSKRSAHAAAQSSDDSQSSNAGPSNYYRRSTSTPPADTKGKGKDDGYRFPKTGRSGGEPDPFEIMGIDRSSSQSEVKKQCMSPYLLDIKRETYL